MKFFRNLVAVAALSANNVVSASPLPVAESVDEAAPVFGRAVCRPISKPKGRLFSINGKTEYFACKCPSRSFKALTRQSNNHSYQRMVAWPFA